MVSLALSSPKLFTDAARRKDWSGFLAGRHRGRNGSPVNLERRPAGHPNHPGHFREGLPTRLERGFVTSSAEVPGATSPVSAGRVFGSVRKWLDLLKRLCPASTARAVLFTRTPRPTGTKLLMRAMKGVASSCGWSRLASPCMTSSTSNAPSATLRTSEWWPDRDDQSLHPSAYRQLIATWRFDTGWPHDIRRTLLPRRRRAELHGPNSMYSTQYRGVARLRRPHPQRDKAR